MPTFVTATGPVRVARLIRKPDGTPDGGVAPLFTIAGRTDAAGCTLSQTNFAQQAAAGNLALRIPTPVFGAGLVEAVPDGNLLAAFAATASQRASLGIAGRFNRNGNDGTISRFGWKAQNKSLLLFAGEAYNVEQGVTNELFPNEDDTTAGCQLNATPEDRTHSAALANAPSLGAAISSDLVNFAMFMRLSAPPVPAASNSATSAGQNTFAAVGCSACHIPTQRTAASNYVGSNQIDIAPYSDYALHDMGDGLADGIAQGLATGREFRTAPLWGLGQRMFFLHDGRAASLVDAISQHGGKGSEANAVISRFNALPFADARNLLLFLRSL